MDDSDQPKPTTCPGCGEEPPEKGGHCRLCRDELKIEREAIELALRTAEKYPPRKDVEYDV